MIPPTPLPRMRGGVVGATSALTGIAAHAAAQGMLPETSVLLLIAAASTALGLAVTAAPRLHALPALIAGQALVHVLLVLTSGHHHDLVSTPMAVMHTLGTIAAVLLLTGAGLLLRAASALALRVAVPQFRPQTPPSSFPVSVAPATAPVALLFLGAIGRRGPPISV
ncbi:hypothetical protein [Gordonia sp. (in: high G+C Gram-positive bacteria)]|uniref:hypothetical protein n=1 Tax=Gordonia sp. (in: high G+C Gram-positive bacteria) TaxID=84139 RepID=UPI003C7566EE